MRLRSVLRWTLWVFVGASAIVLGAGWSLVRTETGRALVTRWVAETISAQLNGRLEIGGLSGSVWAGLTLRDVVIVGPDSAPIARFPTIDVRYWPLDFLGGRVVLRRLMLSAPQVELREDSAGVLNVEALVRRASTDSGAPSSPYIAFYDVTVQGGHISIDEGDGAPRTIDSLDASFAELILSSPDERGISAVVRHLAADVSDPPVRLRELEGRLRLAGDSLEFTSLRLALDRSRVAGEGVFRWPTGDVEVTATVDLEEADASEFAFLSDLIPRGGVASGRAAVAVGPGSAVAIDLDGLQYRDGATAIDGRIAVETDGRTVVVRDVSIRTVDAEMSLIEPLLDTVPFDGTITGLTELQGPLGEMRADIDWAFRDRRAEGQPTTYITASGRVGVGGGDGLLFHGMDVASASVALATVRTLVPAFALRGRLGMFGRLTGPWRNATLNGTIEHHDEGLPVSVATGRVRLDTRTPKTQFDAEVITGPLALDGIRASYPAVSVGGSYRGRLVAEGPLEALRLDVDFTIGTGRVRGRSIVGLAPDAVSFTDLDLALDGVDPSALWPDAPPGEVTLTALGSIVVPDSGAPTGGLRVNVAPSRLAGTPLDTAAVAFHVRDQLVSFEALEANFVGVRIGAAGTLAWRTAEPGSLTIRVAADSLAPLDSLFLWAFPTTDPTSAEPLRGAGEAVLEIEGSWQALGVRGEATGRDLTWRSFSTPEVSVEGAWGRGEPDSARVVFAADTLDVGKWGFGGVSGALGGPVDDLAWTGRSRFGRGGATVLGGRLQRATDTTRVVIDSLRVLLPSGVWTMEQPRRIVATDSAIVFDRFELVPVLGGALLAAEGRLPKAGRAAWTLEGRGLRLVDVYDLVQFDTVGIGGQVDVEMTIDGTARDPRISGSMRLTDGSFRDFRAPLLDGTMTYSARELRANVELWPSVDKAGTPILTMTARLPLDLALAGAARRRLPGVLEVRANADQVDMSVLGAMTTLMEQVDGRLKADVAIAGTWEEPALTGTIEIREGSATWPGLNVRHDRIYADLKLRGDTILVDRMAVQAGAGTLNIGGHVRLIELTRPNMDLWIIANGFELLDVRDQLSLVVSTQGVDQRARLTGPFIGARLTGSVLVNEGVLYFRDLLEKRIVSLEDSLAREVFSIEELRARGLGTPLRTRLLDSLRIRDLQLEMGPDVWLRSGDANVQLGGQLTVEKDAGAYRLDGTLNAQRGTYRLPLRVATRQFIVTDGSVQYFGTPDLNAQLDLNASYTVTTVPTENEPEQIEVFAHIGGTLLAPRLTLTSDVEPPLPETEIISYLLFGRPSFQLAATGEPTDNQLFVVQQAAGLLSGELERALVSDLRVPLDYLELRPSDVAGGPWVARAGVQLGQRTFVIASATYCPVGATFLPGATLQYRFSRQWRTEISAEPVNLCRRSSGTNLEQQFGFDLLWERRY